MGHIPLLSGRAIVCASTTQGGSWTGDFVRGRRASRYSAGGGRGSPGMFRSFSAWSHRPPRVSQNRWGFEYCGMFLGLGTLRQEVYCSIPISRLFLALIPRTTHLLLGFLHEGKRCCVGDAATNRPSLGSNPCFLFSTPRCCLLIAVGVSSGRSGAHREGGLLAARHLVPGRNREREL